MRTGTLVFSALAAPLLLVLAGPVTYAPPPSDAEGCSTRPVVAGENLPDFGVALDGEILALYDRGEAPDLLELDAIPDPEDIQSIEIVCWAAVERIFEVRVAGGISSIWTYQPLEGAHDFLREALAHTLSGGDLDELTAPRPEWRIAREDLEDGGFHLELEHPRFNRVCWVSSVDHAGVPGGRTTASRRGTTAGEPVCASLHDHGGSGR